MLYHWNVRHASHSPYVATVQTISFCKSISVIEQFWVFRAVVVIFFLPFLLCLSAFLLFCASMNFVCVGGDYISSVSEFLLTWKGYRSLWAVGIARKWYWMLSNFTDKYIWWKLDKDMEKLNEVFDKLFAARLGRIVGFISSLVFFHWGSAVAWFVRLVWKILNCSSMAELDVNCSTHSFH